MTIYSRVISIITTLLTPIVLLGIGLRLLLFPAFLQIEYRMPGFPEDQYGFSLQDRLHWAPYAVKYLTNNADISYLGDLRFPNGTPLYNERELSHMQDVKRVTKGALNVLYAAAALLILLGLGSRAGKWEQAYLSGLKRGGWLMIALAGTVAAVVLVGMFISPSVFWDFFSGFHALFFEGDSWLFYFSDTLIRLFPLRFWQDTFLFAAAIAVLGGLGLALGIKRTT